jgi:hypothetical protein
MPIASPPAPANNSALRIEKPPYPLAQSLGFLELAFPNRHHFPTFALKRPIVPIIAFLVALKFWKPKIKARFWQPRERAACVPMPEAAMDEDNLCAFPENDVRASRQVLDV